MSKKKYGKQAVRNRLENLFADLEKDASMVVEATPTQAETPSAEAVGVTPAEYWTGQGQVPFAATTANLQVPVKLHEGGFSLLEIIDDTPGRVWTDDEKRLVEQVADQLSLALENARLFEQIQANLAETESLYMASAEMNTAQSYTDILAALRKATLLGDPSASHVSINLFDRFWEGEQTPDFIIPIAHWSQEPTPEPPSPRYPIHGWKTVHQILFPDKPTIISKPGQDPRLDETARSIYIDRLGAKSLIFIPLVVAGQWIGHIIAVYRQPIDCPPPAVRRLMALAGQAAVSVQNLRLYAEIIRRAAQLETAAEIARHTSGTLALDSLLKRAVNAIRERYGFYHASIFLLDEAGLNALVRESTGEAGEEMKRNRHQLPVGSRSVIGYVTHTGKPLVINDVERSHAEPNPIHQPNPLLPKTRAEVAIPLKIGNRVLGALDVQSNEANAFSEDDTHILQILADQIAIAVDNARAYEEQRQTGEKLRELDKLKSQFLANMSHELRTPLNSIIGFSRVIIKGIDGPISDMQLQDLNAIYNAGQHLLNLINAVLDISKIEAGKMELNMEDNVDLGALINSVTPTATGLLKDKTIHLHRSIDPNLPIVRADVTRIRQVLINFLSNAAKFTEEGIILIEAGLLDNKEALRLQSPGHPTEQYAGHAEVIVKVTDTGPGISLQDQEKLFQPFSQVDNSPTRKTGGSGLGLSISRLLIEMHGGCIGVESVVGKGSTFYFTLPLPSVMDERSPLPDVGEAGL